jgi:hypothetical protein
LSWSKRPTLADILAQYDDEKIQRRKTQDNSIKEKKDHKEEDQTTEE